MSFQIMQQPESGLDLLLGQLGGGLGQGINQALTQFYQQKQAEEEEKKLLKQGYTPLAARLYKGATEGGKTEITKQFLEELARGGPGILSSLTENSPRASSPKIDEIISEEIIPQDEGLTPRERAKREEGRFAKQLDKYGEIENRANSLGQEKIRIDRLQELNKSGQLPTNLGRLNVSLKSGNLIVPFASSPEAQEFVKIVNDFLSGAKDTFGSRVTNFEINTFLKRLPNLLNSEQGRDRVLRQMEIINELNQLHTQGILDEVEKAGGVRKIDLDRARAKSNQINKEKEKLLKKEYEEGESFLKDSSKMKVLNREMAQNILSEAKGDKEMARKIAKKRGYEF